MANNVEKSLIGNDSGMAGVFAEKSIFVLIVGGGWRGKTRFEGVVGLKRFVGNDGGCCDY